MPSNPAAAHSLGETLAARAHRPVELAKGHLLIGAGLADHPRRDDRAGDEGGAAHHRVAPEDRDQPLVRVDAVLQRNDRGLRPDDRADLLAGALDIPQLDAQQHVIDEADAGQVVGGLGGPDQRLAAVALDPETVRLHRREMRAARDKGDVRPGLGQRGAVGPADPAGADDRDAHLLLPLPLDLL